MVQAMNIVAVQPVSRGQCPETELEYLEQLVRAAVAEHRPDLVVLPAGLTVGNRGYDGVPAAVRPVDGAPLQMLRLLSRELGVVLAGGFHARRGADAFSTYAIVESNGCTHLSNASALMPQEARWCHQGKTAQGTKIGDVRATMLTGLEWAQQGSSRQLAGQIQLALGGMSWPTTADALSTTSKMWTGNRDAATLDRYLRSLPLWQSRLFGAPAVLAVHGTSSRAPGLGATQIVSADGGVVASIAARDGEGYIAARVTLPTDPIVQHALAGRWIGPGPHRIAFDAALGRAVLAYQRDRVSQRHPWQLWPGADLPDESGPSVAHSLAQATTFDWKAS